MKSIKLIILIILLNLVWVTRFEVKANEGLKTLVLKSKAEQVEVFVDQGFGINQKLRFDVVREKRITPSGAWEVMQALMGKGDPAEFEVRVERQGEVLSRWEVVNTKEVELDLVTETPGKYELVLVNQETGEEVRNEFWWGVLAVNTNKPVYKLNEEVKIDMAVLDELGEIVCGVPVWVEITDPSGETVRLSTEEGMVLETGQCGVKQASLVPDYETRYSADKVGEYRMRVGAITDKGEEVIQDRFLVEEEPAYEIERFSGTRIYPLDEYPMIIRVVPGSSFKGIVREQVPLGFRVREVEEGELEQFGRGGVVTQASMRVNETEENLRLEWEVDWRAGQEYFLAYMFDAPDVSPNLYKVGGLRFGDYTEARVWLLANDAVETRYMRGDQHTVNSLTAYDLETTQSSTSQNTLIETAGSSSSGNNTVTWGIRVWKRASGGTETEITSGTPVAQVTRSAAGSGLQNNTWTPTSTSLELTDSIVVRVYAQITGSESVAWTEQATYTTEQLGAYTLDATAWSVYYYTDYTTNASGGPSGRYTRGRFYWGTSTYDSRITSFEWSPPPTINVSGVCKAYDQSTNCADGRTVKVAYDSQIQAQTTTTLSGAFTVTGLDTPSNGTIVTVFLDGDAEGDVPNSNEAVAVAKYNGGGANLGGLLLYEEHLTIGSDDNQTLTNADLSSYDNSVSGDEDIFFEVDGNNDLVVDATSQSSQEKLYIKAGNTYRPDSSSSGNLSSHDVQVVGTLTADSNTLNLSGSWINSGTFTADSSSVIMTATSGSESINSSGATLASFNDLTLGQNSGSTTWSLSSALDVDGELTIDYGTLAMNGSNDITIAGDFAIGANGNYTKGTGSLTMDGTTTPVALTDNRTSKANLGTLVINGSSKTVNAGSGVLMDSLEVAANQTINLGSNDVTIGATTSTNSGGISNSGVMTHTSGTMTVISSSGGTAVWQGSGTIESNNLTIGDGATSFSVDADTNSAIIETAGDFTITAGAAFSASGGSLIVGGNFTNNGEFVHNDGTISFEAQDSGNTITTNGDDLYVVEFDDNGTSGEWTLSDINLTVHDLTITGGSVTLPSGELTVNNTFANSDSFDHNSGTVNLATATSPTLTTGCATVSACTSQDFNNLTLAKSSSSDTVTLAGNLKVVGTLSITTGKLTQSTYNVQAEGTSAVNVGTDGIWSNTAAGDVIVGGSVANSGIIDFRSGSECGTTDSLSITSTSSGIQRSWTGSGTFTMYDVSVRDQGGSAAITVYSGTNVSGNGANWIFEAVCPLAEDSTSATATGYSFQRKTFYNAASGNEAHWRLYHDGNQIDVHYSQDNGTTWVGDTSLSYDTNDFSVWTAAISGTEHVWLAVADGGDIKIRQGTVGATSIVWDNDVSTALSDTGTYSYPYISLDSNNYIWVGARYEDGGSYSYKLVTTQEGTGSQTGDSDPSTWTWSETAYSLAASENAVTYGNIVPLSGGDMYATFTSGSTIAGCIWDSSNSAWENSVGDSCTSGFANYWSMDETSSPSLDQGSSGNDATWSGDVSSTTGILSNAVNLEANGEPVVWGIQSDKSFLIQPSTSALSSISCDSSHCYGADSSGSITKVDKIDGTIVWGTGGSTPPKPDTNSIFDMYCDDTHCYGAHNNGYMTKVAKSDGTVVWGTGGSTPPRPYTNAMYGIYCDSTHCYGAHVSGGYMTKVAKSDGTIVWGTGGSTPPQPIDMSAMLEIFCDDTHCYGAHTDGYMTKVAKSDGTIVWGTGGSTPPQPDTSSINNLFCDSTHCYATHNDGYITKVLKADGTVVWGTGGSTPPQPNSIYLYGIFCDDTHCYASHSNGSMVKVAKSDGTIVWGTGGSTPPRPSTYANNNVFCDETYCYGAHSSGYMTKVVKSDGTVVWGTGGSGPPRPNTNAMYSIYCDSTHCYGAHAAGYLTKVAKSDGTIVWGTGGSTPPQPNSLGMNGINCDDTHCYGAHFGGYMTKVAKSDGTVVWGTGGSGPPRPNTNAMYSIYCDSTHCYGAHAAGYMTKVTKSDGTVVWDTDVLPNTNAMNGIYCDDTYCYGAHNNGYMTKVAKSDGTVVWGTGGSTPPQPNTSSMFSIYCDDTHCYGEQGIYLTKVDKSDGSIVWGTGGSTPPEPHTSFMYSLICDDTFCYGGLYSGFITKVAKSDGTVVWGTGGSDPPQPHTSSINSIYCDDTHCYGAYSSGELTKILKSTSSEFLSISSTGLSSAFTISTWVRVNAFVSADPYLPIYGEYVSNSDTVKNFLAVDKASQKVIFDQAVTENLGINAAESTTVLEAGQWYHVVAVQSADNSRTVYVNGNSEGTSTETYSGNAPDTFAIGAGRGRLNSNFYGDIDEMKIYNNALSADEVEGLYFSTMPNIHQKIDTFTSSGTWTAPDDVTEVTVEVWGAGGGSSIIDSTDAMGGGGGAYSRSVINVTPSTQYSITVGTSAADTDGGDSSFGSSTVVAKGGLSGANGGTGGQASSGTGTVKYGGGNSEPQAPTSRGGGTAGDSENANGTMGGNTNGADGGTPLAVGIGANGVRSLSVETIGGGGLAKITYETEIEDVYPLVKDHTWGRQESDSTNHSISIPEEANPGELLLLVFSSNGNPTASISDGWTKLSQESYDSYVTEAVFFKFADGDDSAVVTTSTSEKASWIVYRIARAGIPSLTMTNGNLSNPNPPLHTPEGGSNKFLWLVSISDLFEYKAVLPENYSSMLLQYNGILDSSGVSLRVGERFNQASSEDPGSLSYSSQYWVAATISVPPATITEVSGSGSPDEIGTGSGSLTAGMTAVSDNSGRVNLAWVNDSGNIVFDQRGSDWSYSPISLDAGSTNTYLTVTFDFDTNDLYAIWVDSSNNYIYYRQCDVTTDTTECMTIGNWQTEMEWQTAGTNTNLTSNYSGSTNTFAMWTEGTGSPFQISWDKIGASVTIYLTQNDFEWFVPQGSVSLSNSWPSGVGADIAENEVMLQLPATNEALRKGDRVRIQINVEVSGANMSADSQAFKLQYSQAEDCSVASSWSDVGAKVSGSVWRLYDESSLADSVAQVNQISTSDSGAEGNFSETNPSGNNPNLVAANSNSEWDWPVEHNGADSSKSYCFRMAKSDDSPLDTYNADGYPRLVTAPGNEELLRHGNFFRNGVEQGFVWAN